MNYEWLLVIVILTLVGTFVAVVLWSIVNAALSNAHKRKLELLEAQAKVRDQRADTRTKMENLGQ